MHFCETTVIGHARGVDSRKRCNFCENIRTPLERIEDAGGIVDRELSLTCQSGHFEEKVEAQATHDAFIRNCEAANFSFFIKIYRQINR